VQAFLIAIEQSIAARLLSTVAGLYPVVSALHLLGISLLVGPILVADAFILRGRAELVEVLQRVAIGGFVLAFATGVILFTSQASKYAGNPAFLAKLGLIALAGMNALAFHRLRRSRAFAAYSIALWLGALLAGRFIAFV